MADFGAGATPYFCDRPFLDLLGKSDRHIARLPPAGPFLPGHNKWDYRYSIGELRPDVVNRIFNEERYGAVATRRVQRLLGDRPAHAAKSTAGMPTTDMSCESTTARSLR